MNAVDYCETLNNLRRAIHNRRSGTLTKDVPMSFSMTTAAEATLWKTVEQFVWPTFLTIL